jgi:hypothetical protein
MRYTNGVVGQLWWDDADAAYIQSRSARYPGADDIGPTWAVEASSDQAAVVRQPDPTSRIGHTRVIGYSPSAGFVLTVIIDPQDWSGVTAWKPPGEGRAPTCAHI